MHAHTAVGQGADLRAVLGADGDDHAAAAGEEAAEIAGDGRGGGADVDRGKALLLRHLLRLDCSMPHAMSVRSACRCILYSVPCAEVS